MKPASLVDRYGLLGLLRLGRDLIWTRLLFPQARIVRAPFYIRGKNRVHFGRGLTTGVGLRIDVFTATGSLRFGDNVELNDYVHIGVLNSVSIGNECLLASKVFISDHNHGTYGSRDAGSSPKIPPSKRPLVGIPVIVADRVWIGEGACILPGVTIGEGAIIGANSVVTSDIPPMCIAAGVPARVIRRFEPGASEWVRA